MTKVVDIYEGELCVKCVHEKSQASFMAESKVADLGHDDSFSPTDLVGTALGACGLNTMGLYAERHKLDITGARAEVTKTADPKTGVITRLEVVYHMPAKDYDDATKKALERCVNSCPVHKAIAPEVEQKITFLWI